MEETYSNPYYGLNFWEFILVFAGRFLALISGQVKFSQLASDEIQIIVLSGVAISSALVGTFLILRHMTMLANALSHTILLGIVFAYLFTGNTSAHGHHTTLYLPTMLGAALMTGILTTFLTNLLTKVVRLQEDASIGLVFTSLFALGIILVTVLTRSAHIGLEVVMGNADALQLEDCNLVFLILAINITVFILFFKEFQITTFDPILAKALGFSLVFFDYLLMILTSATSVGAFRAVGVLMVLALITGPSLTARLISHNLKKMLILASLIGCIASFIGVALARHFLSVYDIPLSTGGIVVCTILIIYLGTLIYYKISLQLPGKSRPKSQPQSI